MQIRSPIPPRLLAGNREKNPIDRLLEAVICNNHNNASSSALIMTVFFFEEKMSPPSFFSCEWEHIIMVLVIRCVFVFIIQPNFPFFSVFGSCHRSERRRRRGLWRNKFTWQNSFVALLGLKKLCIVPANAPILASIGLTKTNEQRACGNSCHPFFVCPICSLLRFWLIFCSFCPPNWFFFLPANFVPVCVVSPLMSSNEKIQEASEGTFSFTWRKLVLMWNILPVVRWEVEPIVFVIATQFIYFSLIVLLVELREQKPMLWRCYYPPRSPPHPGRPSPAKERWAETAKNWQRSTPPQKKKAETTRFTDIHTQTQIYIYMNI